MPWSLVCSPHVGLRPGVPYETPRRGDSLSLIHFYAVCRKTLRGIRNIIKGCPDARKRRALLFITATTASPTVPGDLLWASIDNDDSFDLDQLTVAQTLSDGAVKILVAIADVDGLVKKDSALDSDARHNTTSVYTAAQIFPMLPPRLSTDLTSLSDQQDRPANRRYHDLVTQRLLKAALVGAPSPYTPDELTELASHCTQKEDDANKVERQVGKSAAAMLLASRIGESLDAIVTGASDKGTRVRVFLPPVEGKLVEGFAGRKVGDRLTVQLVYTDVERGYIDFKALK